MAVRAESEDLDAASHQTRRTRTVHGTPLRARPTCCSSWAPRMPAPGSRSRSTALSLRQPPRRRGRVTVDFRQAADRFNAEHDVRDAARAAVRRHGGEMRRRGHELVGPCPLGCSGEGDDRFVVFRSARNSGHRLAWCRRCRVTADALTLSYIAEHGRRPERGEIAAHLRQHGYLHAREERPGPLDLRRRVELLIGSTRDLSADVAARQLGAPVRAVVAAAHQSPKLELLPGSPARIRLKPHGRNIE